MTPFIAGFFMGLMIGVILTLSIVGIRWMFYFREDDR